MTTRLTWSLVFAALAAASVSAPDAPAPRIVLESPAVSVRVTPSLPPPVGRATRTFRLKAEATGGLARTVRLKAEPTGSLARGVAEAAAGEHAAADERPATIVAMPFALTARPVPGFAALVAAAPQTPLSRTRIDLSIARRPDRPLALVPMYASFVTLQALDYHSTTRALSSGVGREANPLVRSIVNHRPAFVAAKALGTLAAVAVTERMWKKHPVHAVVFMAAANTAMAVVVAHNYRVR